MASFSRPLDTDTPSAFPDLASDILAGKVVVVRKALQQAGVLDALLADTRSGLNAALGEAVTAKVFEAGFDRLHDHVDPGLAPAATDAVYAEVTRNAAPVIGKLVAFLFPGRPSFYFEREPNVRFHIPFDRAEAYRKQFDAFAKKRGQGKIAAHGPHRDSWLDCPSNVVNIWIAIGPVTHGNGLTVFADAQDVDLAYNAHGEVTRGQKLPPPMTFDLAPGDLVLFHSDHLHGSELNRTDSTRYVISYRVSFDPPHFPHGHYHAYLKSDLAGGPLAPVADIPARLQPSYVRSLAARVSAKLAGRGGSLVAPASSPADPGPAQPASPLRLEDIPVGGLAAASAGVAVARLSANEVVAVSRTCPHKGADLVDGYVVDGQIVCPWHNLPFDAASGRSPCESLRALRRHQVSVVNGEVIVGGPEAGAANPDRATSGGGDARA